jgi:antirestriction protein ArdC
MPSSANTKPPTATESVTGLARQPRAVAQTTPVATNPAPAATTPVKIIIPGSKILCVTNNSACSCASISGLTFNQASKLGGRIKQGEKSSLVTFWHIGDERTDAEGKKTRPFLLRYYRVFNLCQTEGIAEKLGLGESPRPVASIEQCEAIVAAMPNAPCIKQSSAAWYRPSTDTVGMPARCLFSSVEEYYSTLFHELTHNAAPRVMPRRTAFPLGTRWNQRGDAA